MYRGPSLPGELLPEVKLCESGNYAIFVAQLSLAVVARWPRMLRILETLH